MNLNFDLNQDFDDYSFGEKPRVKDGWNVLSIAEIGQVRLEKSGNSSGVFITFESENGAQFDSYFCVDTTVSTDGWRVANTEAFLSYLAKCANISPSGLASFVGAKFEGKIATREQKQKPYIDQSTGELVTPAPRQVQDFARGRLVEILRPVQSSSIPF